MSNSQQLRIIDFVVCRHALLPVLDRTGVVELIVGAVNKPCTK